MATLYPLEIHTPYRLFYSESVLAISLTLIDGEIAVYANHSSFTAPVIPCLLKIREKDGTWKIAFCAEGILEVGEKKTILISDDAEWPDEIDLERAQAAKDRAEKNLSGRTFKFEKKAATDALLRANMRLKAWESGKDRR